MWFITCWFDTFLSPTCKTTCRILTAKMRCRVTISDSTYGWAIPTQETHFAHIHSPKIGAQISHFIFKTASIHSKRRVKNLPPMAPCSFSVARRLWDIESWARHAWGLKAHPWPNATSYENQKYLILIYVNVLYSVYYINVLCVFYVLYKTYIYYMSMICFISMFRKLYIHMFHTYPIHPDSDRDN